MRSIADRLGLGARSRRRSASLALLAAVACGAPGKAPEDEPPDSGQVVADTPERPPVHVDSIFPIEEELRRFRALLGPEPEGLRGGATSRDALVDRFIAALVAADTAAFENMAITIDEFGWLYYPSTRFTAPPYELPPGMVWFQIQNGSSRGIGRLLQRMAGRPLTMHGYRCNAEPVVEGENRIWQGCVLSVDPPGGDPKEMALFGSILERDGVFKFVSYTNDF